ncbi:MAG: 3-hydroxybutyryl-CoA dehydrogenase [Flavobacteriales bacterium TMED123]|nr:MAG: 3-hydroxybutyryl-CoA dehydrogenase [Flavobacteriales bacterium TMED123]|tara:strand:- start:777 stop:1928 length:1152 start_codon:yes stop_codon:yes gene_type:complete
MRKVSIIGAGTMGAGIAQVAATKGHEVCLYDSSESAINNAKNKLEKIVSRLVEKERISTEEKDNILSRILFTKNLDDISGSILVIEAIIENLEIKQKVFADIENIIDDNCIIASNTSSLSIASIAGACKNAERVIGIHFFNPAPLMPLVEIIPAVQTSAETLNTAKSIIDDWGKMTVIVKDTPGFIVNRVARPFYGEALRIYEEGIADFITIDWALKELGGFRMGPFELMDYIGNDINYTVTETVFTAFYFDARYKPSFTQKRMMEAGYLGRKSGRGYYDYSKEMPKANENRELGKTILWRVLSMLINEAVDALFLNIATKEDIDLAMTKGVNYPKGLLAWADEIGLENVLNQLEELYQEYAEDRYRPSPLLRRMIKENKTFY